MLIFLQLALLVRGFFRVKKYVFDMFGYIDIMFFIFFAIPSWDLYAGTGYFVHRIADYGVSAPPEVTLKYIAITTVVTILMEIGYSLGSRGGGSYRGNRRLLGIRAETRYNGSLYSLAIGALLILWLYFMYKSYRSFGRSLILFLMPSRKQAIASGFQEIMQTVLPELIFAMCVIRNWEKKNILKSALIPLLLVILAVFSNAQRREMIQGIIFCGLVLLIKYFNRIGAKEGVDHTVKKKPWRKYVILGITAAAVLIPLLWYARNISNQISRGGIEENPFSLHSFSDLLFGSSTTGFDTTLVIDWYDNEYGNLFLHCIRYFFSFWIPRSIYPGKPAQMTQLIKLVRGDWGNLSTFYVNDLYFSFKALSIVLVPTVGWLLSRIYNKASRSRDVAKVIFSAYMFSQIVLLFKNGVSVFFVRVTLFWIMLTVINYVCKKRGGSTLVLLSDGY